MSASGKTTLGKMLYQKLRNAKEKWFFLDGDIFRNILGEDLGHSVEDRRKNAYRISNFCNYLNLQNINVIACVLSIFHDNQKFNKENISNYKEVYIDVKFDKLLTRDNKELYKKALNGELKNVVGVDIKFKPPYSPDIIIDNNADNPEYEKIIENIVDTFEIKLDKNYVYTRYDLLNFPNNYQYSRYEGPDFLKIFKQDRDISLDFLKTRLKKISKKYFNNSNIINYVYKNDKNLILKEFLLYLYNGNIKELEKQNNLIEILIKRFELSKKLFLTYDLKEMKKSSPEFDELLNYPLFSLVLQKCYNNTNTQKKLIYLNVILKVNDIISSIKKDLIFSEEVYYSIEALNGELKIIRDYI